MAYSYAPKDQARFFLIGPPPVNVYTGLIWSNFTRASDAPVISLVVVFCTSQLSFRKMYLAEPSNLLVPDLVITLTIAPCARPYSAETPEVYTDTS